MDFFNILILHTKTKLDLLFLEGTISIGGKELPSKEEDFFQEQEQIKDSDSAVWIVKNLFWVQCKYSFKTQMCILVLYSHS